MEQHSRQTAVAASATLCAAVRGDGLSEVVTWFVGWNICCLLWGLYRARKYNLWSEGRHAACSVHIVTTALQTVNSPSRQGGHQRQRNMLQQHTERWNRAPRKRGKHRKVATTVGQHYKRNSDQRLFPKNQGQTEYKDQLNT